MNNWEEEINKMVFAYVEDRDNLKTFIHSLLKQQREIMIKLWLDNLSTTYEDMLTKFNNAPEPSGVKE